MQPARILSLETAVPPHRATNDEVKAFARSVFAESLAGNRALDRVFDSSTVEERWLAMPVDWYAADHGWAERAGAFEPAAIALLADVAGRALAAAGVAAAAVDHVLCISTTGFAAPSLDARLIGRLGLRADVRRTPVFGWGCAGGVIGLARAADLARLEPGRVVLCLVVELCSLAFRPDPEPVNVIGSALFGDGAAAAVLCAGPGHEQRPSLVASGEHTWPDSLDVMGWRIDDVGFGLELRRDLPAFLAARLRPVVDGFLDGCGLTIAGLDGVVGHPGGPKVLQAVEQALGLGPAALADSRAVLTRYGNASAAGVLMVLRRAIDRGARGRHLMLALGPGFTAALNLLEL
ncbi:MAG: type III polyketide synthase [Thalassobaculum sp.]|uniref:type III polyketide synthase n=1 Tax=Thalassobaculum sp. TaxID=2022740 RepID=UPI0032EDE92D